MKKIIGYSKYHRNLSRSLRSVYASDLCHLQLKVRFHIKQEVCVYDFVCVCVCLCVAVFWFSFLLCLQHGNRQMTVIFWSNSGQQTPCCLRTHQATLYFRTTCISVPWVWNKCERQEDLGLFQIKKHEEVKFKTLNLPIWVLQILFSELEKRNWLSNLPDMCN